LLAVFLINLQLSGGPGPIGSNKKGKPDEGSIFRTLMSELFQTLYKAMYNRTIKLKKAIYDVGKKVLYFHDSFGKSFPELFECIQTELNRAPPSPPTSSLIYVTGPSGTMISVTSEWIDGPDGPGPWINLSRFKMY